MHSLAAAKALVLIGAVAAVALAENPIISHRYLADPNGFVYNQRLYAICSKDDDNNNSYGMKGSILVSTKDLMNWTDHGEVYHAPKDGTWGTTAYAPSAVVRDGKVYYYVPNSGSAIGVVVADRPEGPMRNPKSLISGSLCDGVAWCFDPGAFIDDDGQAYLTYGGGSSASSGYGQNIRIIKLNKDMVSLGGSPIRLPLDRSFEGPFLSKYKGNYYLQYPMEGSSNIGLSMSTQPTSGWTHKGSILDNPSLNGRNINGNNNSHTSILEYEGQWYMLYHDRRLSNGVTHKRNISIEKMSYNADGTIKKVVVTTGIPQTRNFNPYDSIPAVTYSKQNLISAHTDVNNTGVRRVNLLVPRKSGAWMRISSVDFATGAKSFQIQGGGTTSAAKVEIRTGSENGTLAGTCSMTRTNSWTSLATATCDVTGLTGVKDLYLKFTGTDSNAVFTWFKFLPTSTSILPRTTIESQTPTTITYTIHDLHGTQLRTFETAPGTTPATAWRTHNTNLPTGPYILRAPSPNGPTSTLVMRTPQP